jgi:hypothetical protein
MCDWVQRAAVFRQASLHAPFREALLQQASWRLSFLADSRGKNAQRVDDLRWVRERFLLHFPEVTRGFSGRAGGRDRMSQVGPAKLPALRVLSMNLPRVDVLTDEISKSRVIMGRL